VGAFSFKDIRWVSRSLSDFGTRKAFVVVFTDTRCPVAAKYLPVLSDLAARYEERGVQFLGMSSSPLDTLIAVAADALEKNVRFPVHKDFEQRAMQALGVERTPGVAVLDAGGVLRYRGRIDDRFRVAGEAPGAGRLYLEEALEAVLAGKPVAVEETPVEGCIIERRRPPSRTGVTYAEHVAPIVEKRCQPCHRPHAPAPFPLLDYEDVAGRAETICEVVEERRMPPSFRDPRHGDFVNHSPLAAEEIDVIASWVAAGAPRGDPAKEPPPVAWPEGEWQIGQPDLVLEMPREFRVPASGYVDYRYATLEHEFPHDTWVQAIQILPGNPRVVHHANLYEKRSGGSSPGSVFITGFVPGGDVTRYGKGSGVMIRKGSRLRLQVHYTTTGKEEIDRTRVGLVYAKETIRKETRILFVVNPLFEIPPRDPHAEVTSWRIFTQPAVGVGLFVHMHVRGKDMTFIARYPDGREETLLSVPSYSFDWQLSYRWAEGAKRFPAGTVIKTVAHYDNSPLNPFNPDPSQTVRHGEQTYEEMNYGFVFYVNENEDLAIEVDPATGRPLSPGRAGGTEPASPPGSS
jgi:peroxiredoxin